jgi:osmotically-inducible protein OsmY
MKKQNLWLAVGMTALALGCTNQDSEHLSRLANKLSKKLEMVTDSANGKLSAGWRALHADFDELTLDARISARLRWDKALVGSHIQVLTRDGVVELKGTVQNLDQRRRAVEVAESTIGADKVNDLLDNPAQAP